MHKATGRWQAGAKHRDVFHHGGLHDTEEEAARAYDDLALSIWGRFARLNNVDQQEQRGAA